LVYKTYLQGQASGLKKISTFWRFACGSSLSKGSFFFATLAGTASTLSSCAPAHSAPVPPICNVMGLNHPTAFPVTVKKVASFGAHRCVAACFVAQRSLNPHAWLLLPP
jgi:hypothetical protein